MRANLKTFRAIAALVALQATIGGTAQAADLAPRMYTKTPIVQVYSWTGFYVGAHVGGAWSDTTASAADAAALTATYGGVPNPSGVFGGGQIGYNYQFQNNVVFGIELIGGGGPGFSDRVSIPGVSSLKSEGEYYVLLGGKLGYAFDRWLPYVLGGGALAGNKANAATPFGTGEFKNDHEGYFVGAGIEYAFVNRFSIGIEYRYIDLDRRVYGGVTTGSEISTVLGRVNYHF